MELITIVHMITFFFVWFRWQESNLQACATSDLQSDTLPIGCHRNKLAEAGRIELPYSCAYDYFLYLAIELGWRAIYSLLE